MFTKFYNVLLLIKKVNNLLLAVWHMQCLCLVLLGWKQISETISCNEQREGERDIKRGSVSFALYHIIDLS